MAITDEVKIGFRKLNKQGELSDVTLHGSSNFYNLKGVAFKVNIEVNLTDGQLILRLKTK